MSVFRVVGRDFRSEVYDIAIGMSIPIIILIAIAIYSINIYFVFTVI